MTTKCQKCGIIWNDELDECLNCGSIISAPLIPDASVSDLDAEEFSKQTGVATTDPYASYSSRTSFALTILGSVGVFLLGSIGWVLSPIGIALIVPCYGVGIYYLASSISKWN